MQRRHLIRAVQVPQLLLAALPRLPDVGAQRGRDVRQGREIGQPSGGGFAGLMEIQAHQERIAPSHFFQPAGHETLPVRRQLRPGLPDEFLKNFSN